MDPMEMETNFPVGVFIVIGAIIYISWTLANTFKEMMQVNPNMAGDGLVGIENVPNGTSDLDTSAESTYEANPPMASAEEQEEEQEQQGEEEEQEQQGEEEEEQEEEEQEDAIMCDDCDAPNGCLCEPTASPLRIVANEISDEDEDEEDEDANPLAARFTQILCDIDTFQTRIDDFEHRVETTKNLCSVLGETTIQMNDTTMKTLTERISNLQSNLQKEFKMMVDTQEKLAESVHEAKLSIGSLTESTLDTVNSIKKTMDDFKLTLADYVTQRSLLELKTQMDEMLKRTSVQKTVYQAWNGTATWTDFNEGSLNIQMVRKKFTTVEQNDEWLLPENKTIAAYNRDQLLGLSEENWVSTDNTVFTKRYYKDDWDASVEVAITVTLSKKIMVPPGGKPEVTVSHILRKLAEKEQIQWEHLLVNV